jgi:hypothetical protein
MMRHFLMFFMVLSLIIAVGTIAQTTNEAKTPQESTESTKTPWVYPIAPGVWYPGEPLPEKPFRYYRIRCWPGCHHGGSPYAKYPDKPKTTEATTESTKVLQTAESTTESTEAPRVYPIAAGVWYPGEPLPEKPFRYYRIRCWPGCHHGGSPYAKYPDKPTTATTEGTK